MCGPSSAAWVGQGRAEGVQARVGSRWSVHSNMAWRWGWRCQGRRGGVKPRREAAQGESGSWWVGDLAFSLCKSVVVSTMSRGVRRS